MAEPLKILNGIGKRLEIHDDRVVIKRTDMLGTLLPNAFSEAETVTFDQISHVNLHEPEHLRLDECRGDCLQLIVTRRDHSTLSLTLNQQQYAEAKAFRADIEKRMMPEATEDCV